MRTETRLFTVAVLFRALLLVIERSLGIDAFFHIDSLYYIDHAEDLWASGFDVETLWHYATTNGYVLIVAAFLPTGLPTWGPIILNLLMSAAAMALLYRVALLAIPDCNPRAAYGAILLLALLPYQAHLSIHVLKDTSFIFFSVALLWAWLGHRPVYAIIAAIALISIRSHLALIEFLIMAAAIFLKNRFSWRRLGVLYILGFGILAISGFGDRLIDRGSVEFDGRAFFESLPVLRVTNLFDLAWMGAIAPFKSICLPNILLARNFSEIMYASEVTLVQVALLYFIVQARTCLSCLTSTIGGMYLTLALGGFWFVEITTPSYGPLVRYREFFWIILSFITFYCFFLRFKLRW